MNFLSTLENEKIGKNKNIERFSFFNLNVTERNWTGDNYVPKDVANIFLSEVKKLDNIFKERFSDEKYKQQDVTILIDTSIFKGRIQENTSLLEFLEEIEDFRCLDNEDDTFQKNSSRYLRKLLDYAKLPENYVYLIRWLEENKEHAFSNELENALEKMMSTNTNRFINFFETEMKKIAAKMHKKYGRKESLDDDDLHELAKEYYDEMYEESTKRDCDFLSRIFKYSIDEPSLFYYSLCFTFRYFYECMETMNKESETRQFSQSVENFKIVKNKRSFEHHFLYFERNKNDVEIKKTTLADLNYDFRTVTSLDHFTKEITFVFNHDEYAGISELTFVGEEDDGVKDIKELLIQIGEEIAQKLPDSPPGILPTKRWASPIKHPWFTKNGIRFFGFLEHKSVMGPDGKEVLVKGYANTSDHEMVLFTLLNPAEWKEMNVIQCSFLSYAICLYYDIVVGKNYHFEKLDNDDSIYALEIVDKNKSKTTTGFLATEYLLDSLDEQLSKILLGRW